MAMCWLLHFQGWEKGSAPMHAPSARTTPTGLNANCSSCSTRPGNVTFFSPALSTGRTTVRTPSAYVWNFNAYRSANLADGGTRDKRYADDLQLCTTKKLMPVLDKHIHKNTVSYLSRSSSRTTGWIFGGAILGHLMTL